MINPHQILHLHYFYNLSSMKQLLQKFRIHVLDVIVVPDVTAPPSDEIKNWFDSWTDNLVRPDDAYHANPFFGKK